MKKINKVKIFKIILFIIAVIMIIGTVSYLIPLMKDISTIDGQIRFKEKIDSLGIYGIMLLAALQLAQIFLIILPRRTFRSISWNVLWPGRRNNIYLCNCMYYNDYNIFASTKIRKKIYI